MAVQTIPDAPYIREAEIYGFDAAPETEQEYRSGIYAKSIAEGLKKARDLIQQAVGFLEGLPEDTTFDDDISTLADDASDLGSRVDDLASKAERW